MKKQLALLIQGLLLMALMLYLAGCAAVKQPEPMSPPSATAYVSPPAVEESGGLSRGLGYAPPAVPESPAALHSDKASSPEARKKSRSGLATQKGNEQLDQLNVTHFYRKLTGSPDAVDSFHYNDGAGAKAMADALGGGRKKSGDFEMAGGRLEVALRRGGWPSTTLDHYDAGDRRIVIGDSGGSYRISVKNRTNRTLEIVASVDGLDVMSGRPASTGNHGYVLPPKSEMDIKGFRSEDDHDRVREFVFGSVDSSAAAAAGMGRNVGVIGFAVYEEDEAQAKLARLVESQKRAAAIAFPVGR
ncbi:MAG: hypothetical protein EOP86_22610 [Verrucomicrobiaceae bacterium]|nr:MAG: hypothetical protein EOP86_22610 [Verrucomicrobiaceae bacterium]